LKNLERSALDRSQLRLKRASSAALGHIDVDLAAGDRVGSRVLRGVKATGSDPVATFTLPR